MAATRLWGACDPLITPRPLGPLRDMAGQVGGEFAAAVADGSREDVLAAALEELADARLVVIEDLHWADDATLDLVALARPPARRAPAVPRSLTAAPDEPRGREGAARYSASAAS